MKIMLTGHRPQKLGGFESDNPVKVKIIKELEQFLIEAKTTSKDPVVITGMAIGADQWWAHIALELGCKVHAYIPFTGQEKKWPASAQKTYHSILERCDQIHVVSNGGYESWKMQARNRAMVDAADACIAVWDGTSGGTANCIEYIRKTEKPVVVIDPKLL